MIFVFFIFFELASLPGLAVWSIESIPIKVRAVLVTLLLFLSSVAVIDRFLKKLGLSYNEIGVKRPLKQIFKSTVLFWVLGSTLCFTWVFIYFSAFEKFFPAQYNRLIALKTTGYIQFLFEWGRAGGFCGTLVLWSSLLLLAVIEELAFRGLVFSYLKRKYSFKEALVWSSALFTLAHFSPYNFPVSFVLGVIFALLYARSGGLVAPILTHFTYNISLVYFGKHLY